MKRTVVFLCLILAASSVSWAEGVSVTEFLSSAAQDPTLHFQNEKVEFPGRIQAQYPAYPGSRIPGQN